MANQELGHRLKNTLSLVQAIATQTFRGTADLDALNSFSHRISALGHAQDILLRQEWSRASLFEVIVASLEPHNTAGRITMDGPDFQIGSRAAVAISLMLNELATNAAKYGALSSTRGHVQLGWRIDDDDFSLRWHETGGPEVTVPEKKGFGTRLIDMGLGPKSTVDRHFAADGLRLQLRCALSNLHD